MCWRHVEFPPVKNALHFPRFATKSSSDLYYCKSKDPKLLITYTHLHILHQRPGISSTVPSCLTNLTYSQSEKIVSKSFVSPLFVCFISGTPARCSSNKSSFTSIESIKTTYQVGTHLIDSLALTVALVSLILNHLHVRFPVTFLLHFLGRRGAAVVLSSLLPVSFPRALWNISVFIIRLAVA